jgi:hypothetical protein
VNPPGGVAASKGVNRPFRPARSDNLMQMNEMFVALGVPLGAFFMAVAIVALVGYFNHQERKQRHESIRLALEKGQSLPPELLTPTRLPRSDLASGIQLVFVGIGLSLFLWLLKPGHSFWAVGIVVLFVGLGRLVSHALVNRPPPVPPGGPSV